MSRHKSSTSKSGTGTGDQAQAEPAKDVNLSVDKKGEAYIRFSQEFEEQNNLLDATKEKSTKIIERLQSALIDPYDFNRKNTNQPNRYEALADALMALGQRLPVDSKYGMTLMAVNRAIRVAGGSQRSLQRGVGDHVMMPLRIWVKDVYSQIAKQRQTLNKKRQDMEAATKRAMKPTAGDKERQKLDEVTRHYKDQWTVVKNMMDKLQEYHEHHRKCIVTLLNLEKEYHAQALQAIELSAQVITQLDKAN